MFTGLLRDTPSDQARAARLEISWCGSSWRKADLYGAPIMPVIVPKTLKRADVFAALPSTWITDAALGKQLNISRERAREHLRAFVWDGKVDVQIVASERYRGRTIRVYRRKT